MSYIDTVREFGDSSRSAVNAAIVKSKCDAAGGGRVISYPLSDPHPIQVNARLMELVFDGN